MTPLEAISKLYELQKKAQELEQVIQDSKRLRYSRRDTASRLRLFAFRKDMVLSVCSVRAFTKSDAESKEETGCRKQSQCQTSSSGACPSTCGR